MIGSEQQQQQTTGGAANSLVGAQQLGGPLRPSQTMPQLNYTRADIQEQYLSSIRVRHDQQQQQALSSSSATPNDHKSPPTASYSNHDRQAAAATSTRSRQQQQQQDPTQATPGAAGNKRAKSSDHQRPRFHEADQENAPTNDQYPDDQYHEEEDDSASTRTDDISSGRVRPGAANSKGRAGGRKRQRRSHSASRLLAACLNIPTQLGSMLPLHQHHHQHQSQQPPTQTGATGPAAGKQAKRSLLGHLRLGGGGGSMSSSASASQQQQQQQPGGAGLQSRLKRPISASQTAGDLQALGFGQQQQQQPAPDYASAGRKHVSFEQQQQQQQQQQASSSSGHIDMTSQGEQQLAKIKLASEQQQQQAEPNRLVNAAPAAAAAKRQANVIMKNEPAATSTGADTSSVAQLPDPLPATNPNTIQQQQQHPVGCALQSPIYLVSQRVVARQPASIRQPQTKQQQQQPISQAYQANNNQQQQQQQPQRPIQAIVVSPRQQQPPPTQCLANQLIANGQRQQQPTLYKRLAVVPMRTQATQTEITSYHLTMGTPPLNSASSSSMRAAARVAAAPTAPDTPSWASGGCGGGGGGSTSSTSAASNANSRTQPVPPTRQVVGGGGASKASRSESHLGESRLRSGGGGFGEHDEAAQAPSQASGGGEESASTLSRRPPRQHGPPGRQIAADSAAAARPTSATDDPEDEVESFESVKVDTETDYREQDEEATEREAEARARAKEAEELGDTNLSGSMLALSSSSNSSSQVSLVGHDSALAAELQCDLRIGAPASERQQRYLASSERLATKTQTKTPPTPTPTSIMPSANLSGASATAPTREATQAAAVIPSDLPPTHGAAAAAAKRQPRATATRSDSSGRQEQRQQQLKNYNDKRNSCELEAAAAAAAAAPASGCQTQPTGGGLGGPEPPTNFKDGSPSGPAEVASTAGEPLAQAEQQQIASDPLNPIARPPPPPPPNEQSNGRINIHLDPARQQQQQQLYHEGPKDEDEEEPEEEQPSLSEASSQTDASLASSQVLDRICRALDDATGATTLAGHAHERRPRASATIVTSERRPDPRQQQQLRPSRQHQMTASNGDRDQGQGQEQANEPRTSGSLPPTLPSSSAAAAAACQPDSRAGGQTAPTNEADAGSSAAEPSLGAQSRPVNGQLAASSELASDGPPANESAAAGPRRRSSSTAAAGQRRDDFLTRADADYELISTRVASIEPAELARHQQQQPQRAKVCLPPPSASAGASAGGSGGGPPPGYAHLEAQEEEEEADIGASETQMRSESMGATSTSTLSARHHSYCSGDDFLSHPTGRYQDEADFEEEEEEDELPIVSGAISPPRVGDGSGPKGEQAPPPPPPPAELSRCRSSSGSSSSAAAEASLSSLGGGGGGIRGPQTAAPKQPDSLGARLSRASESSSSSSGTVESERPAGGGQTSGAAAQGAEANEGEEAISSPLAGVAELRRDSAGKTAAAAAKNDDDHDHDGSTTAAAPISRGERDLAGGRTGPPANRRHQDGAHLTTTQQPGHKDPVHEPPPQLHQSAHLYPDQEREDQQLAFGGQDNIPTNTSSSSDSQHLQQQQHQQRGPHAASTSATADGAGEPLAPTSGRASPSPPTTVSELDQDEELSTPSFVDSYRQRLDQVQQLADSVVGQLLFECLDVGPNQDQTRPATTTTPTLSWSSNSASSSTAPSLATTGQEAPAPAAATSTARAKPSLPEKPAHLRRPPAVFATPVAATAAAADHAHQAASAAVAVTATSIAAAAAASASARLLGSSGELAASAAPSDSRGRSRETSSCSSWDNEHQDDEEDEGESAESNSAGSQRPDFRLDGQLGQVEPELGQQQLAKLVEANAEAKQANHRTHQEVEDGDENQVAGQQQASQSARLLADETAPASSCPSSSCSSSSSTVSTSSVVKFQPATTTTTTTSRLVDLEGADGPMDQLDGRQRADDESASQVECQECAAEIAECPLAGQEQPDATGGQEQQQPGATSASRQHLATTGRQQSSVDLSTVSEASEEQLTSAASVGQLQAARACDGDIAAASSDSGEVAIKPAADQISAAVSAELEANDHYHNRAGPRDLGIEQQQQDFQQPLATGDGGGLSTTEQDLAASDYTLRSQRSEAGQQLTLASSAETSMADESDRQASGQQQQQQQPTLTRPSLAMRRRLSGPESSGAPGQQQQQPFVLVSQRSLGGLGGGGAATGSGSGAISRASPPMLAADCPYVHDIQPLAARTPSPPIGQCAHAKRLSHDDTMEAIEDDVEGEEQELKLLQQQQQQQEADGQLVAGEPLAIAPPAGFSSSQESLVGGGGSIGASFEGSSLQRASSVHTPAGGSIKEEDEEEEQEQEDDDEDEQSSISVSQKHGVVVSQEVVKRASSGKRAGLTKAGSPSHSSGSHSSSSSSTTTASMSASGGGGGGDDDDDGSSSTSGSASSASSPSAKSAGSSQREPLVGADLADGRPDSNPDSDQEETTPVRHQQQQHQQLVAARSASSTESGTHAILEHLSRHHPGVACTTLDEPPPHLEQSRPLAGRPPDGGPPAQAGKCAHSGEPADASTRRESWRRESVRTETPTKPAGGRPVEAGLPPNSDELSPSSSLEQAELSSSRTGTMKRRAPKQREPLISSGDGNGTLGTAPGAPSGASESLGQELPAQQQQQVRRGPSLAQLKQQTTSRLANEAGDGQQLVQEQQQQQQASSSMDPTDSSVCSSCSCLEPANNGADAPDTSAAVDEQTPKAQEVPATAAPTTATAAHAAAPKPTSAGQQQQQQAWMSQDEGTVFTENYWLSHWLYISEHEEAEIWRRSIDMSSQPSAEAQTQQQQRQSVDDDDDEGQEAADQKRKRGAPQGPTATTQHKQHQQQQARAELRQVAGMPRDMTETGSTKSECNFSARYKSTTRKMIHRRATIEMYKRLMSNRLKREKRVEISRSNGEFGFRIHGSRPVVVSAIERGTSAETCGLQVGDLIYAINGTNILDMAHSEVVQLAHTADSAALVLDLVPTNDFLRMSKYNRASNRRHEPTVTGFLMRLSPSTAQPLLVELQQQMAGQVGVSSQQRAHRLTQVMRLAWRQRYYVLRSDNCLYWYKTPTDVEPHGGINLQGFSATLTDEFSEPAYVIRLVRYGGQPHYLGTNNMCDIQTWIDAINRAATEANQNDPYMRRTLSLARARPSRIAEPDCSGWLYKYSHKRGGGAHWRQAYFVLKDACLYLFREQRDELASQASAVYYLHGYRVRSRHLEQTRFTFELVPPNRKTIRPMLLRATNEIDKKRWIAALEYSIDRWIEID